MSNRIYYNIHAHIFDASCIPNGIMGEKWAKIIRFAKKIRDQRILRWLFPQLLQMIILPLARLFAGMSKDKARRIKKIVESISIGGQMEVFEQLMNSYKKDGLTNYRFVALCQNMDHNCNVNEHKNVLNQMLEVATIRNEHGNAILPFVGVDPRHYNDGIKLREMVKVFIEDKKFVGIKIYPSQGFFPDDTLMDETYKYAEENDLPIMIHFNVGVIYYRKDLSRFNSEPRIMFKVAGKPVAEQDPELFQMNFTNPLLFKNVLDKFPKLKLCFAHFAGDYDIKELDRINTNPQLLVDFIAIQNYPKEFMDKKYTMAYWHAYIRDVLIPAFPNVYTDVSYQLADKEPDFNNRINNYLTNRSADLGTKILFGTDFYVNIKEGKEEAELVPYLKKFISQQFFDQIASKNNSVYLSSKLYLFKDVLN